MLFGTMEYKAEIAIGLKRNPREALAAALSKLTTMIDLPKDANQILIKPSIYDPKLVGNTEPKLVRAIVNTFKDLGKILIIESDNPIRTADEAFKRMNYPSIIGDDGDLINLSNIPLESFSLSGNHFETLNMPSIFSQPYFLINVPTLKLELGICTIGGGIKNLFGLIPEVDKRHYHENIDDVLVDLLLSFRPHLTIMDLTSLVIGNRENGVTKNVGAVLVSTDPVAIDAFCSDLLGMNPMKIPHLKRASDLGLGEILPDMIKFSGTNTQREKLFERIQ